MVDVKRAAAIALTSALADLEEADTVSPVTIQELRLAHSLLTEGEPSADELRAFLGGGWVNRSRRRSANMAGVNAITEAEYASAQIRAMALRLALPERFVAARLQARVPMEAPRSTETIADLIDLMTEAANEQEDCMSGVTWWAIIRLTNGNNQRVEIFADGQTNARLMLEAQFGPGSILSGPHRLDLMRIR